MTKLQDVSELIDQLKNPETDQDLIILKLVSFLNRKVDDATFDDSTVIENGKGLNVAYCALFWAFAVFIESKNEGDLETQKRVVEFMEKFLQNEHIKSELAEDINKSFPDDEAKCTLLGIAALHHMTTVAGLLIETGADVNLGDKKGNAPIHHATIGIANLASRKKDYEEGLKMIELLVSNKADNKSFNKDMRTPYNLLCDNVQNIDDSLRKDFLKSIMILSGKLQASSHVSRLVDGGKTIEEATEDLQKV